MQQSREGLLIIISGPSGVGKGTVCKALMERNPNMRFSVSCTTRPPRPGEVDGLHYFFKTRDEFLQMVQEGAFLEHMQVFGNHYYGTPRAYVEQQRASGFDILLDIDVHGAMHVKSACPDAVTIFLAPPSMSSLKTRLVGRGTETVEAIEKRFEESFHELRYMKDYDYVVSNDVLDIAIGQVEHIIAAERLRVCRNQAFIESFQVKGEDGE